MLSKDPSQTSGDRKVALVTGAGTGIGRAIVLRLAKDGYDLAVNDINLASAEATVDEARRLCVRAAAIVGDVGERISVQRMVEEALKEFGKIDALVNNAGVVRLGMLADFPEADWRALFRVNVDGVFFCCQRVVSHMTLRKRGAIVNISSWNGKSAMPFFGAYSATKFAVIGLTQALAKEVAPHGVRVNAVCPGIVAGTAMRAEVDHLSQQIGLPTSTERAPMVPLKRLAESEDIARVVAFLLSDEAAYMTGQAINVTGGLWMH
jgi:NAD(P)-dependent dehydrogenase (short-subunit alcohol dehydrogenase family)